MGADTRRRRVRYAQRLILVSVATLVAHVETAAAMPAAAQVGQARLASAGGSTSGRVLGGTTAQKLPMIATISSNGKRMDARVTFGMTCRSGNTFITPDGWNRVPIPASGVVRAGGAIPPIPASGNGAAITGGFDGMTGKLNRKRATFSGFWELQLNFAFSNGQTDSCDSGRVAFSLRL